MSLSPVSYVVHAPKTNLYSSRFLTRLLENTYYSFASNLNRNNSERMEFEVESLVGNERGITDKLYGLARITVFASNSLELDSPLEPSGSVNIWVENPSGGDLVARVLPGSDVTAFDMTRAGDKFLARQRNNALRTIIHSLCESLDGNVISVSGYDLDEAPKTLEEALNDKLVDSCFSVLPKTLVTGLVDYLKDLPNADDFEFISQRRSSDLLECDLADGDKIQVIDSRDLVDISVTSYPFGLGTFKILEDGQELNPYDVYQRAISSYLRSQGIAMIV